ncbi:hypothetical protein LQ948_17385 [Jiella sp. MQZ9-1]|uniref:DUF995 domain-containing protein n=1 Tax=Jiella flava TaxID=2816857 RepID=A0A939G3E6_9HYPH|nr:hypothetical protein [Jiella flava]MBO0664349.1 hypothetical protein [Jiella flava]MCD2472985.1 hypothetical protein [Jiella flava]
MAHRTTAGLASIADWAGAVFMAVSLALCVVLAGPADGATEGLDGLIANTLDDHALAAAFAGKHLEGVYADARHWSESYTSNGTLSYRDAQGEWSGDWSVRRATFCTFYQSAALNGGCFVVAQRGANCFDFYTVGPRFVAIASADDIRAGRNWTARGWYVGAKPSCPKSGRNLA